jgi:spore coat protein U-like protein
MLRFGPLDAKYSYQEGHLTKENSMKKQMITLATAMTLLSLPAMALAATATGTLNATASVSAKCFLRSTTNVAFGEIDPTTNGNYDGTGTIVTHCTKGTLSLLFIAPTVPGALAMASVATPAEQITYALYTNAGATTPFPSAAGGAKTVQPGGQVTTTIYGRVVVASGTNDMVAAASDYTQALTATIEW